VAGISANHNEIAGDLGRVIEERLGKVLTAHVGKFVEEHDIRSAAVGAGSVGGENLAAGIRVGIHKGPVLNF